MEKEQSHPLCSPLLFNKPTILLRDPKLPKLPQFEETTFHELECFSFWEMRPFVWFLNTVRLEHTSTFKAFWGGGIVTKLSFSEETLLLKLPSDVGPRAFKAAT